MKTLKNFITKLFLILTISKTFAYGAPMLPKDFVYLKDIAPTIQQDIRYASVHNFVGRPLPGYESALCILTKPTALALLKIQTELNKDGLSLKVFDGYRPQSTVDEFIIWSQDAEDQKMKAEYYPNVNKADFFKLGYAAKQSGHSRGSTVDVTIVSLKTNQELDMGTPFDFMDERSHPFNTSVTDEQYQNRQLLNRIMSRFGFIPLSKSRDTEWWHFTLKDELFPDTYFNFPVKDS